MRYEVPQFNCVPTVDMNAARNAATIKPRKAGGRKSRSTIT